MAPSRRQAKTLPAPMLIQIQLHLSKWCVVTLISMYLLLNIAIIYGSVLVISVSCNPSLFHSNYKQFLVSCDTVVLNGTRLFGEMETTILILVADRRQLNSLCRLGMLTDVCAVQLLAVGRWRCPTGVIAMHTTECCVQHPSHNERGSSRVIAHISLHDHFVILEDNRLGQHRFGTYTFVDCVKLWNDWSYKMAETSWSIICRKLTEWHYLGV